MTAQDSTAFQIINLLSAIDKSVGVGELAQIYSKEKGIISRHTAGVVLSQLFRAGVAKREKRGTSTLYRLTEARPELAYSKLVETNAKVFGKGKKIKGIKPDKAIKGIEPQVVPDLKIILEVVGKIEIVFRLG